MIYSLGRHSLRELQGVAPLLVRVVHRSIEITTQDYTVFDGIRLLSEQEEYVRTGVSQTLHSKHLKQADGFGHAVDNVPYINGKLRWELQPMFPIARSMRQAAEELGATLRWGGCWQIITGIDTDLELMVAEYIDKKQRQGKKFFVDAPHYELVT